MTLREICKTAGVTRRAIQGYEKAGLVSRCGKTERGYLLYDENTQERICQIRLYQQMRFSIKEIKVIIDAPNEIKKQRIEAQIEKLKEEGRYIESLIDRAYELIGKL